MKWQALPEATREPEETPRFVPALGVGLGGGLGEAVSREWPPVRKAVRRAGAQGPVSRSRPFPSTPAACPPPQVPPGGPAQACGVPGREAQGPSRAAQIPSFSLKFRTPWTFGRSAECASSEQFVFHGAFASITPLLLCLFLDHWGWRRPCQSAVGAGQRGGREGRPLVAHLHTPVPGTGPRGALNTEA